MCSTVDSETQARIGLVRTGVDILSEAVFHINIGDMPHVVIIVISRHTMTLDASWEGRHPRALRCKVVESIENTDVLAVFGTLSPTV